MMDWQALGARLEQALQKKLGAAQATAMAGGDINQAFRLDYADARFFVKINRTALLPMFTAERAGLEALRESAAIRVPEVYLTGSDGERAYIVMEYIELTGRPAPEVFAQQLAALHAITHRRFGFPVNNTIGSTPQVNSPSDNWIEFWQQHRLGYQLELGARQGFDHALLDAGEKLNDRLAEFFRDYSPLPSLLHGDLWGGNQGADELGNPVIYDPACYYGDHEADLAMMELFGHPGERFFAAYAERFPIDAGYAQRRELYNLYHVLNHANLFGGGYAAQARRMIESLLAQTGD